MHEHLKSRNRIFPAILSFYNPGLKTSSVIRYLFTYFLCLHTSIVLAQVDLKKYVNQHAFPVLTISPEVTDYHDLEPIGNAIGEARVVMLGEVDHGDAPSFLAKTRLVKYLHEKKKFSVLAFESDFFGLNEGWDHADKQAPAVDSFLKENVLSLWANCNTCSHLLYKYIPSTLHSASPLHVTGFDNQTAYTYSRRFLVPKLDSVMQQLQLPITQQVNYSTEIMPLLNGLVSRFWHKRPDDASFSGCEKVLRTIKSQSHNLLPADDFWSLVIDNLISFNLELKYLKTDKPRSNSIRDMQMYLNLQWLARVKYPNQKVIAWAANTHVAKYSGYKYVRMGKLFNADTSRGMKSYVIGFTSYSGETGRLWEKKYMIPQPARNSFESWIPGTMNYVFVDFTRYNREFTGLSEKFKMRGVSYQGSSEKWNSIFDGMFYIREMYPCEAQP